MDPLQSSWPSERRVMRRVAVVAAILSGSLLLTACSQAAPSGVDAATAPSAIPALDPPSKAFSERADAVLGQLRTNGTLRSYAASFVLLSPRVVDPGYPTSELKDAFGSGGFKASPSLGGAATTRTVRLADGSSRTVPVLGAVETLELARRPLPGCDAVGSAPCPVVVTRAVLGSVEARTNHGTVSLPAWQYWADGMTEPYRVIAVDESALVSVPPLGPPSEADQTATATLLGAQRLLSVQDQSVTVLLGSGACDLGLLAHVREADDAVVVGGSRGGSRDGPCVASMLLTPATLTLSRPLGTRPVVDVASGSILPVTP